MTEAQEVYEVACHACGLRYDALAAAWCTCLVTERSLVCPHCHTCFCQATRPWRQQFWAGAPKAMWERKHQEYAREQGLPPNPEPDQARRPLVLLVDDEPDIRRAAGEVITGLGYGLVVGRSGAEGLELARRYRPDVVLTDALMPKLDGRDMAGQIKRDPSTAHAKVVVMTSLYTSVKYRTEAFKVHHVDEYLSKPVAADQLRQVLRKLLETPHEP